MSARVISDIKNSELNRGLSTLREIKWSARVISDIKNSELNINVTRNQVEKSEFSQNCTCSHLCSNGPQDELKDFIIDLCTGHF